MTTWTEEQLAAHLAKQRPITPTALIPGKTRTERQREAMTGVSETIPTGSKLERDFLELLHVHGLPTPEREFKYVPGRRFAADFCYRRAGLLIEMEGGVWGGKSGHNSGDGIERDCQRARLASLHGYRVYRITRKALDETGPEIAAQIREILAPWETEA